MHRFPARPAQSDKPSYTAEAPIGISFDSNGFARVRVCVRVAWPTANRVAALNAHAWAFGLKSIATEVFTVTTADPDQYATVVNGD
ncbi:hypothetical protein [Moorena sp. SIO4G3]|uniref:hypothetical protein n=1 Tax=Moorena sp. SIO4G3 TaxID=2607821 RepID=UPI0014295831|nr:hypothetical protein [Moorena sp. SIO4G3]NEO77581.1 hypothetical protein [Moorena sp. SIO4G3]